LADCVSRFEQRFGYNPLEYILPIDTLEQLREPVLYLWVQRVNESSLDIGVYICPGDEAGNTLVDGIYLTPRTASLNLPEEVEWRTQSVKWSDLGRLQLRAFCEAEDAPSVEPFQAINPAVVEPLSLAPSDVLRSYAHARGKPLIALLPENAVDLYTDNFDNPSPDADTKIGALESYLAQWEWIEGPVLVAKPRLASYWWNRRYPRERINSIIERAQQRGYLNSDDYILARQLAPEVELLDYANWWFEINGIEAYWFDQPNVQLLQTMGSGLWQRLLRGETLRASDLPPPVLQQLHHLMYEHAYGVVEVVVPDAEEVLLLPVHCYYPNGIPPTMLVRLKKATEMGFFSTRRNGIWSGFMKLTRAHWLAQTQEPPYDYSFFRQYWLRARRFLDGSPVQYVARAKYDLELIPLEAKGAQLIVALPSWYALVGKPTPWNQPPDEAKAAFEEAKTSWQDDEL
ncbi:MAG: hypothetical protein ACK4UU_02255, partial [Fimbriimonadales bacterium]